MVSQCGGWWCLMCLSTQIKTMTWTHIIQLLFTGCIRWMTEGNVFTLSTIWGGGVPVFQPTWDGKGGTYLGRRGGDTYLPADKGGTYLPVNGGGCTYPGWGGDIYLGWGDLPSSWWGEGYLPAGNGGTYLEQGVPTFQLTGGVPTLVGGVPTFQLMGVPPGQCRYPSSQGRFPPARVGTPSLGRYSPPTTASTCYVADGMPPAFMQEDFLVFFNSLVYLEFYTILPKIKSFLFIMQPITSSEWKILTMKSRSHFSYSQFSEWCRHCLIIIDRNQENQWSTHLSQVSNF